MKHHLARTATVVTAVALLGLAGCGDDDQPSAGATTSASGQTTATATATQTQTQTSGTSTAPVQREAVVPGKQEKLQTGDIGVDLQVVKVADPVAAYVDRAQKGNKLVGVFVKGQTSGVIEPTKVSAVTSLQTTDGKVNGLRVIADGDCGGGFSINDLLLSQKQRTGCIGFEIPKDATPESITIVLTSAKGSEEATWKLPKAT